MVGILTLGTVTVAATFEIAAAFDDQPRKSLDSQEHLRAVPFSLVYVDAEWAAKRLKVILGERRDLVITTDVETNTVFIRARAEDVARAESALYRLDVRTELHILPVKFGDAFRVAEKLRMFLSLTAALDGGRCVTISPTKQGNMMMIVATAKQVRVAKALLEWIDVRE